MNNKNIIEISESELENVSGGGIRGALVGAALCSSISYVVGCYLCNHPCNCLQAECRHEEILIAFANGCLGAVLGHNLEEDLI